MFFKRLRSLPVKKTKKNKKRQLGAYILESTVFRLIDSNLFKKALLQPVLSIDMRFREFGGERQFAATLAFLWSLWPALLAAQPIASTNQPALLEMEGQVEVSRGGSPIWDRAYTNQVLLAGDRVRTGQRSRAVLRLSATTTKRLGERTIYLISSPSPQGGASHLLRGLLYFFHRDRPGSFPVQTPSAYAVVLGTEFVVEVAEDDTTILHVIDGVVTLTNEVGKLELKSGQSGVVKVGQPPAPLPTLEAANVIQWCLYYPGVLDPDELNLTAAERQILAESLTAYRDGDLQAALARYPETRQPNSDAEKIYLAALLLAVGKVDQTESLLASLAAPSPRKEQLAEALRTLIAAVKFQPRPSTPNPQLTTSLLASSWYAQSQGRLGDALTAARRATEISPRFGFAWARVAEMEFSFGRVDEAMAALDKALQLSPRNAEAISARWAASAWA